MLYFPGNKLLFFYKIYINKNIEICGKNVSRETIKKYLVFEWKFFFPQVKIDKFYTRIV